MLSGTRFGRTSNRAKRDNSERWLLTYADLITLLLAFFVVMYAISSADVKKFAQLAGAMRKAFNVGVLEGAPAMAILEEEKETAPDVGGLEEGSLGTEMGDLQMIMGEMNWIHEEAGLADNVSFSIRPEGIAVSISGNLLFSSGRAELRPDSLRLLRSLARALSRLPNPIRVEGHTDDIPPKGTGYPSNWELSGARAIAVVRHLAEVEGIDANRLSAAAYSQYQPVAPNDSARVRALNRRTEILILYPTPAGLHAKPTVVAPGGPEN